MGKNSIAVEFVEPDHRWTRTPGPYAKVLCVALLALFVTYHIISSVERADLPLEDFLETLTCPSLAEKDDSSDARTLPPRRTFLHVSIKDRAEEVHTTERVARTAEGVYRAVGAWNSKLIRATVTQRSLRDEVPTVRYVVSKWHEQCRWERNQTATSTSSSSSDPSDAPTATTETSLMAHPSSFRDGRLVGAQDADVDGWHIHLILRRAADPSKETKCEAEQQKRIRCRVACQQDGGGCYKETRKAVMTLLSQWVFSVVERRTTMNEQDEARYASMASKERTDEETKHLQQFLWRRQSDSCRSARRSLQGLVKTLAETPTMPLPAALWDTWNRAMAAHREGQWTRMATLIHEIALDPATVPQTYLPKDTVFVVHFSFLLPFALAFFYTMMTWLKYTKGKRREMAAAARNKSSDIADTD